MHVKHALMLLLVGGIVPLSGCIGVDNMSDLKSRLKGGPEVVTVPAAPTPHDPVARIDVDRTRVRLNTTLTFDASRSSDADGRIAAWNWTVDGVPLGSSTKLVHRFDAQGTHRVRLTVTDDEGRTDDQRVDIDVFEDDPPDAALSITDADGREIHRTLAGRTLTFSAEASSDPEGDLLVHRWELGDGTRTTGASFEHVYEAGGRYDVRLVVEDPANQTDRIRRTVVVDERGLRSGRVTVEEPDAEVAVPVREDARKFRIETEYAADLPLEDLDLSVDRPNGSTITASDDEDALPGNRTLTVEVPSPTDGTWIAEVTLERGDDVPYTVRWTVLY